MIRLRRLMSDADKMKDLAARSPLIDIEYEGDPPERYIVTFHCKGLARFNGGPPAITPVHKMEVFLHSDYPRRPPQLRWLTPIFHPNILPPEKNGGVCIGAWSPQETLAELCLRIGEMVQYKRYNVYDALDIEAAKWAASRMDMFPVDSRDLL